MPKTYPIEGGDLYKLTNFVLLASDPAKLTSFGEGGDDLDVAVPAPDADNTVNDAELDDAVTSTPDSTADPEQDVSALDAADTETQSNDEQDEFGDDDDSNITIAPEQPTQNNTAQGGFEFPEW